MVLENTPESPSDCKEIKPLDLKENQSWILIGRTDAEAPIFWPPDAKSWLIRKDPDAGKDWRLEEKGMTEEEMVGWYHWSWWTWVWVSSDNWDGQRSLVCCSPWGCKESDMTEQLNWTELNWCSILLVFLNKISHKLLIHRKRLSLQHMSLLFSSHVLKYYL